MPKNYNLNMFPQIFSNSSLHCNISLSFCSFLYSGVYFDQLKLTVNDLIVSQEDSMSPVSPVFQYYSNVRLISKIELEERVP